MTELTQLVAFGTVLGGLGFSAFELETCEGTQGALCICTGVAYCWDALTYVGMQRVHVSAWMTGSYASLLLCRQHFWCFQQCWHSSTVLALLTMLALPRLLMLHVFSMWPLLLHRVCQVSCGPYHAAAVGIDGRLFTWGDGLFGKLGHGDHSSAHSPRFVTTLAGGQSCAGSGAISTMACYVLQLLVNACATLVQVQARMMC